MLLLSKAAFCLKTKRMLKYIFPLLVLLTACGGQETEEETVKKDPPKVVVSFKDEADMDKRVFEIDAITGRADMIASSLYYSKSETNESIQVDGHMDADGNILKIEEFFNEGNDKNSGRRLYYLNDGKPFVTIEQYNDVNGLKPQFVDRVSYYDKKGNVIKTKERRGDFQDLVEKMEYKPIGLAGITMDRAMRAMNQEKEFETTFQGFIDQDVFTYLSVGENKPDGFRSTMRCDFKDRLIDLLYTNSDAYIGEKLLVEYQKQRDVATGFEFQIYRGGKFADEPE